MMHSFTIRKFLRSSRIRVFMLVATLLSLLTILSPGFAVDLTGISAQWRTPPQGTSGEPTCWNVDNTAPLVELRYGDNDAVTTDCPASSAAQSGFGFTNGNAGTYANGTPFILGEFTHYNNQVFASSLLTGAFLDFTFTSTNPSLPPFETFVSLDETANNLQTCPYGDTSPCADQIRLLPSTLRFTDGTTDYQLETVGFIPGTLGTCTYSAAALRQSFISEENADNPVCLFARVAPVADSEMQIDKTTEATSLVPGAIVDYQIDYTCASTTSTCDGVEIVDFLPPELLYLSSTGSIHTVSTTGAYSAAGNNVLFDFIDPLPAGSTGFVRIRARVRDDGTLANGQEITNRASSTLSNGPTSNTSTTLSVTTTSSWDVQKTALTTAYISSEPPITDMTYRVQICPAGSNVNLLNAQMVDTLPPGSVYVSSTGSGVYNAGAHTVTWALGDLAASAGCAAREVTIRFPNPPFSAGSNVLNSVTGTGTITGGTPFSDTANVPSTLQNFIPVPGVTLDKGTTRNDYVVGSSVDYFLTPRNTGNTNLYNLRMVDDLPAQIRVTQVLTGASVYPMTLEYAINGSSTYTTWAGSPFSTNTTLDVSALGLGANDWITSIRWTFNSGAGTPPNWSLTSPAVIRGTITSPDRLGNPIPPPPTQIVNSAYINWEYLPGGMGDCTNPNAICGTSNDGATIDVVTVPVPVYNKTSAGGVSSNQRFIIGQNVGYYLLSVDNNTGILVNNLTITDDIPVQFNVTSVNLGSYVNYTGGLVGVRYAINGGALAPWPATPFAQGTTLNVEMLSLPPNTYISQLEFSYDQVTDPVGDPPAVSGGFAGSVRINGSTLATDRNGNSVAENDAMTNNSRIDWTFLGSPNNRTSNVSNPIHQPTAQLSASKSTTSSGPYIPTSAVSYRLSFGASGSSPSNIINAPVVADLLPLNVNYVDYTFNANGTALNAPTLTTIPDFGGTGRTLLRWTFTGTMNRGQTAYIDLNTTLSAGTPNGALENTFAVSVNDMPMVNGTPDTQDWDGDTQTTDLIVTSSTSVFVDQLVGLDSQKRVRGELDSQYSVFPNYGRTVPNGDIDYRLTIINRGNIPVRNVRAIDILPFVGDTGVQDTRPRQSAWRPILTSLIAPQAGVTIYYSTATNPCRPEIVPSGPAGCTAPNWTLTPANLDAVRSVRFDFAGTLAPGQSFTFDWEMRAPNTALPPNNSIAWNSFAFTSTNATTGVPLRPAEPNKVGIRLVTDTPTALIDLKKYTSSVAAPTPLFDADLAPGPQISMLDTPLWTYVITNTGQSRLGSIVLNDTPEGAVTSCTPALTPATILEVGDSMTCTLTDATTAQAGQYANSATVTSVAVDGSGIPLDGDPVTPGVQEIRPEDTDPSHYYGYDPALARIGDYTWIDLDADGVQESGEPALGGVILHLLDGAGNPVIDPVIGGTMPYITTTDADGFYSFNNLLAGTYRVRFEIPSAYSLTVQNQGDDTLDSDADTTTGETGNYTLAVAEYNQTVDAGFIARAALGDRVWMDSNGNGIQDTGEPGYNLADPMQVELLDNLNNVLATTTLDVDGMYFFDDLQPGTPYRVRFPAPPTGYLWTTLNAPASTAANDSNVSITSPYTTDLIALDAGEFDPTWDAGLVQVAAIGDFVWGDADADGVQDGGETGVAGVTVRLLNSGGTQATRDDGTLIADVVTTGSGAYSFTNLRPGDYSVRFTLPAGTIFTNANTGGDDSVDSDAVITTITVGETTLTTLDPGEIDNSWDAGVIRLASLGDFVWVDLNNNGQQNGGETGVPGVVVTLLDSTGTLVTTDALGSAISPITTLASGAYSFTSLDPRIDYIVQFERPSNYVFSPANSGSDTTDSDAVPSSVLPLGIGRTATINLATGENNTTIDAGLVQVASIGNYVFYDNNNDGLQDGGDTPVQNVTVRLLNNAGSQATDERGTLIPDQVTLADGLYSFTNLRPGTYALAFSTLPATYTFAQRDVNGNANDTTDSDPNRFTGRTINTTLDPNENDPNWDAGLVVAAALGDYVWIDANANGQQDGGELPYTTGVTVRLLDGSSNPVDNPNTPAVDTYTTTTNASGIYAFVGLPPNETYRVRFDRPTGYIFTVSNTGADATDSDGVLTGQTTAANATTISITTLTPGVTDNSWDQGVLLPSALGNVVWRDNDDDGLQDNLNGVGGEPGINGVTVRLLDSTGTAVDNPNTNGTQNYTSTTAGSGATTGTYAFTNLYPGSYIVEFVTPSGYKRADYFVGAGANAATDSDMQTAGVSAGRTPTITLPYNTTDNSWDAGFVPLATIGNFVWRDLDNDGIQDGGAEVGVAGATVTLLDAATGNPVTTNGMGNAISPIVTTSTGLYSFTNLDPDLDYIVQFTLPTPSAGQSGFKFSPQDVVGTEATDSDANVTTGRTATIPLNPGQTNNDIDAGLTPLSSLGNFVWVDTDGDGVQDGGELGINGMTVRLLTSAFAPVDNPNIVGFQNYEVVTVTNAGADGYYQFLNLDAGTYVVEFVLPTDYVFTAQDSSVAIDSTDSDANRFTGRTGSYVLGWDATNQTVDAGIVLPASLGDFVWYDADDDGQQDAVAAEAGVNGVVVRLLDSSNNPVENPNTPAVGDAYVFTTVNHPTTSQPGYYLFDGLLPGDYRVRFDLAASTLAQPSSNYVIARQNQGADVSDSDPDRASGITATINLSADEDDLTNDAGILLRGARLGNRVWIDLNNNGVQDVGEVGLNGVTVTLLNGSGGTDIDPITPGTQTLSTTTANDAVVGDGYYQFTSLVPGTFIVEVTLPAGYQFSPQDQGADNAVDSDVSIITGRTAVITVAESGNDQTWDAGVVPLASIGNYTFIDQNNDGVQNNDPQDGPLASVLVHLLDTSNNPVDNPNLVGNQPYTITTDGTGFYRFTNLPPDVSYVVQFDLPASYRRSLVDAGSDDALDSDASLLDGRSPATYLSPDEYDQTVDAGFVPLARLGDFVWVDTDGDGVQDGGESGLNAVTVRLLDSSGNPVDDPTQVGFQNYEVTTANNPVGGAPGYYQFVDLDAGTYIVEFVLPSGYVFTWQDALAATDSTDSDADRFSGRSGAYILDWGDSNQTVDAGIVQPSALGNFVWRDNDNDGVQDGGAETGVVSVVVNLLDGSGNLLDNPNTATVGDPYTTTTDGSGFYSFTGLIPGSYIVEFVLPTPLAGQSGYKFSPQDSATATDATDSDANTTTGRTAVINLPINTTDNRWDAGLTPLSSLGDYVWVDANGDGVQEPDPSEPGLNGVTVRLLTSGGVPVDDPNQPGIQNYEVTTVTNAGADGYYQFINLDAGDYIVEVVLPTGYIFTRPDVGLDTSDSDVDRFTGLTGAYTLLWGDTDQTADAGVLLPASLGNFVWLDANDDGVQEPDPSELGINGVTVHLIDINGAAIVDPNSPTVVPYIVTTRTVGGVAGSYSFVNLFPGDYRVRFDLPSADYVYSRPDVGADTGDSDAISTDSGRTGIYTLVAGQNDTTVDAGMMQRASIGNRVWIDIDNDGVQDTGENGLNGVLVTLTDELNVTVSTVTANNPVGGAPGYYIFENLVPGEYRLNFALPFGYQRSPQDAGSPNDDTVDSDADFTTGDTVTTRLFSDEDDMTWDSGVVPLVSIGDRVWIDIDNNGVQDGSEADFPGVTVNLLDSTGTQIDTMNTDLNGEYLFDLLPPGDYAIEFELPFGYQFSPQDRGGSDSLDSDANTTTGRTINVTLPPGTNDLTRDAGLVPLTSIGDRVWIDINNNGIQDTGEANYAGATVHLLNSSGNIIDTTTTDASGSYLFDLLSPADYAIEVVLPPGYQFSPIDQGADEALDSDVDFATGRSATTTLDLDEDDMSWDAGLVPLTSIGDFVWRDRDGDGVQGVGEPGVSGITINLLNGTGAVIDSTITASDGSYLFDLLPPGDYAVEIDTVPPQFIISPQNQGSDPALDSDVDRTTGRSITTTLAPDEDDMTWDIGLAPLATIGDRVWYDNDGDGVQDAAESGASGITVYLLNSTGTRIATTSTDADGEYLFENLLPGDYRVEFILPGGFSFSPQDTGADDTADSDADPLTGRTELTTLSFDEIDPTWDAGLVALGSIGDFVWNDLDADGVQDSGEPGIPGVVVILTYPNGTSVTAVTDSSGKYLFIDLPAGNYTIRVDENTLPPGYGQTYDLDGTLDHTATYTLAINEDVLTLDFGYVELGSIGDTIWVDTNRNGVLDGNERGIPNVRVTLVLPDGTTRTTLTDSSGKYLFEELYPGEYTVIVDVSTLPRNLQQVFDPDGTRDSRTVIILGAGEHHLTADFGYAPPVVPTVPPVVTPPEPGDWQPVPACQRDCVDWQLYHTNQTGDWEIFRLGNLGDRPSVSPNLSQGEGFDDMSPTRSPNAEWIVFSSNRDGNWELYAAPTDGDSSKTRRLTFNTVATDTDPVWGPNNFVVYETTRDGNWELYLLDMVTGAERRLTENGASDINAFWSNDGAKLLFQSDRSGIWQIYQLDLRTSEVTRLSDGTANEVDAQYSSDDRRIAFRSYRDDADKSALYIMDANVTGDAGDNPLRISDVNGDATNHSWSTDDRLIAYQSDLDGDLDIYVYEVNTGITRQLTANDIADYAPTWNCETTTVVFTSDAGGNPDIYDADALPIAAPAIDVTTDAEQLTVDPAADIYPEAAPVEENASREGHLPDIILGEQTSFLQPDTSTTPVDPSLERAEAWESINGCPVVCPAWTLYQTDRTGDIEIFRLGVDGARDINLSVGIEATDRSPTRAPNAQWIAFTSDRDGSEELYLAGADGLGAQRRVTFNAAADTDPSWSPDSQRIVYESDRDGDWNLYVLDVQTGVETQITDDPANDTNGDWSSAGESIVFQSDRDGRPQLYVYDLGTGETTRLVDIPQDASSPVYANGGSLIAFRVTEDDGHTVIYVVQQDGSGLQAISDPDGSASSPEWVFDDTLIAYQSDLDGDLDIYVHDFASGTTRKLTDNTVADFAPTWICGDPEVIFTSEVTGNDDLFLAPVLPIDDPALDVETEAQQLTNTPSTDRFPVGAPNEEDGSRDD